MKNSRVLLVSPLVSTVAGGIAKWTANIIDYYKAIKPKGIELKPCYNGNMRNPLANESLLGRVIKGFHNYYPLIKMVQKELQRGNVDVVHICTSASIGLVKDLAIIKLAKRRNVRSVVHFHFGRIPAIFERRNWERWMIEQVICHADKVVVMDMASYTTLKKQGFNHVDYIPNPLSQDTQTFIESNKSLKRIPNKVVFVGQMLETKGIFELAEAAQQISNIKVYYIGPISNKDITDKLKTLIDAEKIEICGSQPFQRVIQEMLSASVFVLPSYTEGFPNVIIESMACGCPIVTTPIGAIPEMLDIKGENCGVCVPAKDVESLKNAITRMLNNIEEAQMLGQRAKERVNQQYSMRKVWSMLDNVWTSC